MKRLRCLLFAAIVVISSSMLVLGGDMQGPGKSDPAPTPTPSALTTPTSNEPGQMWQDATAMLMEILLTIF